MEAQLKTKRGDEDKLRVIWRSMKHRCYYKRSLDYEDYGGRGILVEKRWSSYNNFLEDMSPSYKEGLLIERRNNDGMYGKDNCYWATLEQQANNKRNNRYLSLNGESMTVPMWARRLAIKRSTISQRFYVYKWPVERCLSK